VKRKPGEKGAIPPVPPPDCNNAFRAVHKPCKRYLGEVVRAVLASPFSRITLSVIPWTRRKPLSLRLSGERACVTACIYHARTRNCRAISIDNFHRSPMRVRSRRDRAVNNPAIVDPVHRGRR